MTKNREEEIIDYFKGTLFYKELEDYDYIENLFQTPEEFKDFIEKYKND